jgi:hypothetical protein
MSGYTDNFGERPASPPVTDEQIRVARAKVALPTTFLILNALAGIVVIGALTGINASNPLLPAELSRKMIADQPDSQQKQDAEKKIQDFEDQINANPDAARQGIVLRGALLVGTNSLALFGAVMLRVSNRRGWGYLSAIISMIPIVTGVCCTGLPFGLWALIVLGLPSVADGLDAARRKAANPNPDGY